MWRPSATGPYARLGRFYAPYGLRFVEHIYYVRRYTGYQLYNETYNVSGGYVADDWEVHVSAFTPPPTSFPDPLLRWARANRASPRTSRSGSTTWRRWRRRRGSASASVVSRYQGGLVGKLWIDQAKLLFLGEANFIRQQVSAAAYGQNQFVSYLGATVLPVRGIMPAIAYERFQENLSVTGTGRNSFLGQVNVFPWAHCEWCCSSATRWSGTVAARQHAGHAAVALLPVRATMSKTMLALPSRLRWSSRPWDAARRSRRADVHEGRAADPGGSLRALPRRERISAMVSTRTERRRPGPRLCHLSIVTRTRATAATRARRVRSKAARSTARPGCDPSDSSATRDT